MIVSLTHVAGMIRTLKIVLSIIFLALPLLAPLEAAAKDKLAVMELDAIGGADPVLVEIMTNSLKDEIHQMGEFSVISREEIEALANRLALQQQSGECTSSECLADMGKALGTKLLVYGSISKIGNTYSLSLRLLNTNSKEAVARVNERCSCREEELFDLVHTAAVRLMKEPVRPAPAAPFPATPADPAAGAVNPAPAAKRKTEKEISENLRRCLDNVHASFERDDCYSRNRRERSELAKPAIPDTP